jgi:hypothetical protein
MPKDKSSLDALRRVLVENWNSHPKTLLTGAFPVLAWLILTAALFCSGCPSPTVQGWLELVNGATWPSGWLEICSGHPLTFAVTLAARTTLNAAGPLAVIGASVWVLSGGLERSMNMSRLEIMRLLSAEVVSSVAAVVRRTHPEMTPQELAEMQKEADLVVEHYMADIDSLEQRERRTAD